jgi:hypothetical protein
MYTKIVNPKTGRHVNINGKIGKKVLKKYLYFLKGGEVYDNFEILEKYILKHGNKVIKIKINSDYFSTDVDKEINEFYVYKSRSGILWHLALCVDNNNADGWIFKKHYKSYTTGLVLHFEIQKYLDSIDEGEYKSLYYNTKILRKLRHYMMLKEIGNDEDILFASDTLSSIIEENNQLKEELKLIEDMKNKTKIIEKKIDLKGVNNKEQNIFEADFSFIDKEYSCPIILSKYYQDVKETDRDDKGMFYKKAEQLFKSEYKNIGNPGDFQLLKNYMKVKYEDISNKISNYMKSNFTIIDNTLDRDPLYEGKSMNIYFSLWSIQLKNKKSQKQYVLYFILYGDKRSSYNFFGYNLPIIILDLKTAESKQLFYKTIIPTGLYTCKPKEYVIQTFYNLFNITNLRGDNYVFIGEYLNNMWPLNELSENIRNQHGIVNTKKDKTKKIFKDYIFY